ncbi:MULTISPECIES: hypothetical protein [unclassified Serratia (in: enterobacteria)]|uniref:hypothetical protein n=1 Tax=unclassified Serratia (in: enterobacteria) TaxID=2647522 RepID=UPI003076232F
MDQQRVPSPREHHFFVSIAKFLFYHPEHGIVSVQDPIKPKDAERYGLSPLILYGLSVSGLPIRWMTFTSIDHPRPFKEILQEAWHHAEGLRGQPDNLRINRHLAAASPELLRDMEKTGIQVKIANAWDKSLPASLRSAQDASRWLPRKGAPKDPSLTGSLQALCQAANNEHHFRIRTGCRYVNNREVEDRIQQWLALPLQVPKPVVNAGLDWKPGPWLSSWLSSLPPDQPRYFHHDDFDNRICLLTGEKIPDETADDEDFWDDNAARLINNLVACWPNPLVAIARYAGITLRELQWFTSEKAPLTQQVRIELENLLGIEYRERIGSYVCAGPYVLIAHKQRALREIYESLSNGGDACPVEIVPHQGSADPSWRYVLINTYGAPPSIIMAPRGVKITDHLPELLMNYGGMIPVSPAFYRDVVSTCARACREPATNIREMKDFAKRYEEHWVNCAWRPE